MSAGMLSVIFVWLVAAIGVVIMKKLQPETWILYLVWVVVVCILLTLYGSCGTDTWTKVFEHMKANTK